MAKIFEVGDVMPLGQVKIQFEHFNDGDFYYTSDYISFNSSNKITFYAEEDDGQDMTAYARIYPSLSTNYQIIDDTNAEDEAWHEHRNMVSWVIIDFSNCSLEERTVTQVSGEEVGYWQIIEPEEETYTITFNSNGGTNVTDLTEQTNLPSPLPTTTKAGYTFVAWYIDSALTTRAVAGATIEANTMLYAKWHNLGTLFTGIANAIRSKDGTSGNIRDLDFDDRISVLPSPKEEETKTVTPNFSSGNVVVTPTTGKVLSQVTINKDSNLIADNIKKDITVHGITGTFESGGGFTQEDLDNAYASGYDDGYDDGYNDGYIECFVKDTPITLADRKYKLVQDITYQDDLLVWNFDNATFTSAKPIWIMKQKRTLKYNHLVFSDGSELNTVNQHRIFNVEKGMFTYPMTDDTPLGTTTFNDKGEYITLVSKEVIHKEVEYYNIITDYHINLFAGTILTSCRLSNLYPIVDMQYVKDNRELHNPEIFNELDGKWISGLRLLEQPLDINRDNAVVFENSLVDYVKRLERDR